MSELPKLIRDFNAYLAENLKVLKRVEARLAIPAITGAAAQEITLPLSVTAENIAYATDYYFAKSTEWDLIPEERTDIYLNSGQLLEVIKVDESGWCIAASAVCNSPKIRVLIDLYSPTYRYQITATPEELYEAGVTQPIDMGLYLTRYDPVSSIYAVAFTPSAWVPYHRKVTLSLKNEDNVRTRVISMKVARMMVKTP